ncbi:ABC transporter substrate-binding protein [Phytoactinopolyspora limicola]|uniref:ABC transporter substrate-binding protein n=1 Tax=Phytoactinopolyspora limicola TaxID=2715536 RepID=UPI001A9CA791|nr:sugar ABC transporter substrate-binding protein [Phytoactinopolyspora limicola]
MVHPTAVPGHAPTRGGLSRRRFMHLMGAGLLVPVVGSTASCGGGASSLTFVYFGDATQQEAFQQLFDRFNESYPDVGLEAQGIAADDWAGFVNTVATRVAGGQSPDIIQIATEGQRLLAARDILEPLDSYMEADADVIEDYLADIDPNLHEWNTRYASHDGRTYYVPGGYNTVCMWINKETFEAAGVPLPGDDWTWDEFMSAAEQIKANTGAYMLPMGSGYFTDIMPWLLTNGASTFNDDWDEPTYNTPAAIEAVEFCREMVARELAPEPGGAFEVGEAFSRGELAALAGGRWPVLEMRRLDIVDKVKIVPMPQNTGHGSPIGWDAWPITKGSEHKEDAWTFIKYMTSTEASSFYASIGGTIVPARLSVANSPDFLDNAPEGSEKLAEAVSYATPIPSPERGAEAQTVIQEAWGRVVTGTAGASEALDQANQQLAELL